MKTRNFEIIGDSIMKGVIFDEGKYRLYGRSLEARAKAKGIDLNRDCRLGATAGFCYKQLSRHMDYKKDISGEKILFEFGGNDSAFKWSEISSAPDATHHPATDIESLLTIYQGMIDLSRSGGAQVYVATLPPIDAERYFSFITKGLSREAILKWLGDIAHLYRWHENYSRAIERLALENRCQIADLRGLMLSSGDFSSLICDDGIHPTEKGHKLIEDFLSETIVK